MAADSPGMLASNAASYPSQGDGTTNTIITFNNVYIHSHPDMYFNGWFNLQNCTYGNVYLTKSAYKFGYSMRIYANSTLIFDFNHTTSGSMPTRVPASGSYAGSYSMNDITGEPVFRLRLYCGSRLGGDICDMHGSNAYNSDGVYIWKFPGGGHPRIGGVIAFDFNTNLTTSRIMGVNVACNSETVKSYEVWYRRHPGNSSTSNLGRYYIGKVQTSPDFNATGVSRVNNGSGNPTYYAFPPKCMSHNYNYDFILKAFWWNNTDGNRFFTMFGKSGNNNAGSIAVSWCDDKNITTSAPTMYPMLVKSTKRLSVNFISTETRITATTIQIGVNANVYSVEKLYAAIDKNFTVTKASTTEYDCEFASTITNYDYVSTCNGSTISPSPPADVTDNKNGSLRTIKFENLSIYQYHTVRLLLCDGYNYVTADQSIRTTFPFVRIYDKASGTWKRAMPYICDGVNWTPYQAYTYDAQRGYVGMNPDD